MMINSEPFIKQIVRNGENVLEIHKEMELINLPTKLFLVLPNEVDIHVTLKDGSSVNLENIQSIEMTSKNFPSEG